MCIFLYLVLVVSMIRLFSLWTFPVTLLGSDPLALLGVGTTEFVVKFSELERVAQTKKRRTEEEDLCRLPRQVYIQGHGDEPYVLGDLVGSSQHVWLATRGEDETIFIKYLSTQSRRNLLSEKIVL